MLARKEKGTPKRPRPSSTMSRTGYPSASCAPAALASVSPAAFSVGDGGSAWRPNGFSSGCNVFSSRSIGADWKAIDVGHGPGCPKNLLEEAMDTPNGGLVRRCFRILGAKNIGLTITLADITEEEFRVLELIEAERQERLIGGKPYDGLKQ